ncbi:hypothetical protein BH09ACT5_BH09ACT5_25060 [soil metagenome]
MAFDQLGEPVEVPPSATRGQLPRLLLALLGIGLLLGVLFGVGSWIVGTFAQTEQGLCRLTWAACTELSLASVESLSGVDLPEGTEVVSGYAQELRTLHEFRAEVVLPEGGVVTMSSSYEEGGVATVPAAAHALGAPTYWVRPVRDGEGHDVAVVGTRADGRTVIVFDERQVPRAP